MSCPHRKYGVTYGTYPTIKSYWEFWVFGHFFGPSLFGILKTCDHCGKRFVRWPSWEPPINRELLAKVESNPEFKC